MKTLRSALALVTLLAGVGVAIGVGVTPAGAQGIYNSPTPVVTGNELVQFGYRIPLNHRYETYNINTQQYTPVDAMSVPQRIAGGAYVYDRTAGAWVTHPNLTNGRNDSYLATVVPSAPSASAPVDERYFHRIHGTAQSMSGNTLTLRADDGRLVTVDMTQVGPSDRRPITPGEGIEVAGHYAIDMSHMTAQNILQDSERAPWQRAWQKIHGTVRVVGPSPNLELRADDGRWLTIDTSTVSPNVLRALAVGDRVTVSGHYTSDERHLAARFIEPDGAAGAASPRSR